MTKCLVTTSIQLTLTLGISYQLIFPTILMLSRKGNWILIVDRQGFLSGQKVMIIMVQCCIKHHLTFARAPWKCAQMSWDKKIKADGCLLLVFFYSKRSSFQRLKKISFLFSTKLNNFKTASRLEKGSLEMKIKTQMSRIRRKISDGLFPTEQFFSKASFVWIKLKF